MSNAFALDADAARVESNIVAITLLLETMSESEDAAPCRIVVVVALRACAFGANENAFTAVGSKMIQVPDSFIVFDSNGNNVCLGVFCHVRMG